MSVSVLSGNKELGKVYDTMKYKRTSFNKIADIEQCVYNRGPPQQKGGDLSRAFVLAKATESEAVV